ncbi:PTS acetylgalactosamine transporter subunit IIA [Lactococcus petauri]|uniref:PTS sugar transporter subunit IIA n=1 Tax=Lactococcus petauri TaxID=1940789 RepID=UPI000E408281|nr:PTS acetylgalactosamine transporter subunit IIA [Lactococcus petauri]RGB58856.1 PTS acetylgalactosamine transporter subunit IIA [Lactococcus petauri]
MKALISGHAHFAEGMKSAVELITGPQADLITLTFDEATNLEEYQEALNNFCKNGEEVAIFTDLLGGTPFNKAMIAKGDSENVHIFTGMNLPMLIEFVSQGMMETEGDLILDLSVSTAKDGVTLDLALGKKMLEVEESDGI